MAEADLETPTAAPGELMLDPFGYMPDVASRIGGLGGPTPSPDHSYVFHTPYVEAAPGRAHFTLDISGLSAKRGTLILRVHMLRMEEGAHATLVNSDRILLNRLVAHGGRATLRFEGFRGMSFALVGLIKDDTDASAHSAVVTLDRPADPGDHSDVLIEPDSTVYGTKAVRPSPILMVVEPPRLAAPVSQPATAAQLDERAFRDALRQLGPVEGGPADQWQAAYVFQVLQRYGLARAGARGVGFGVERSPIPAALAGLGVEILATDIGPPGQVDEPASLAQLARPALCDADGFARNVHHRDLWLAPIPADIVNFDFCWSIGAADRLGSVTAGIAFVEEAMNCLRPGGFAVHTFGFDPAGAARVIAGGRVPPFVRPDIERLALNLVSRGHEIAQIRIDDPIARKRKAPLPAFGLIARKATVTL